MWPDGYRRILLDTVDSTNAEAVRQAVDSTGPVWICARRQTAGRGRRGRAWAMPEGNFAASLLLYPQEAPATVALRSFVAALALRDAVTAVARSDAGLALKWPNDVLLAGGKMAGILLERHGPALIIGIGVNLVAAPDPATLGPEAVPPVALLEVCGTRVAPETFLDALAAAYAGWEDCFTAYGFAPVRKAWLDSAARLGEGITARTGREAHHGTFETVDDDGALVLKTREGRVRVAAADVYF